MSQIEGLINKYGINEDKLSKALKSVKDKDAVVFTMSGKMGAGKDTVGDIISDLLMNDGYKLINTSFGELIRGEITTLVEGYNREVNKETYAKSVDANPKDLSKLSSLLKDCTVYDRTDKAREALQFWGTEVRRKQDAEYWINKMSNFIVDSINEGHSVNVTDARFPNEAKLVEDLLGKVIRLDVPSALRVDRIQMRDNIVVDVETLGHVSETALDGYKFDKMFDGTETPELIAKKGFEYIKSDMKIKENEGMLR